MAAPKAFASSETQAPCEFFKKQLAGDAPLSFPTAKRLFEKATDLIAIRPWQFLEDQDLILLENPLSAETCYCSVMGALGQVFALHAYLGGESYLYFRKMAAGEPISVGEFYGSLRGVYVEFVGLSQLTPPDRELARVFGHPLKRGLKTPIFRAMRPVITHGMSPRTKESFLQNASKRSSLFANASVDARRRTTGTSLMFIPSWCQSNAARQDMTSRCGKLRCHSPLLRRRPDSIKAESSRSGGETIQFGARSRLSTSTAAEQSGRETNAKPSSAWHW